MGKIFLLVFAVLEITLVVLTFTKFVEKTAWLRNRAIVRLVETGLLAGIIAAPNIYLKWRFFLALFVVGFRFLTAGISWLIRHNSAVGMKKRGWSVVNCLLSIILISVTLVPSFIFANYHGLETTGEYEVKQVDTILVDESRLDEFENDGSFREVPTHFYYPDGDVKNCPLIVFSHGAFGYYQSNFSTYNELASHGYIVAALDHPHHAFFTTDTDGNTVIVDNDFINDAMEIGGDNEGITNELVFNTTQSWLKLRVDDENFVLDTIKAAQDGDTLGKAWHTEDKATVKKVISEIDTDKIGLIGHSLGGASGVAVGRERRDIDAVIDLDGTVLGEVSKIKDGKCVKNKKPYPIPVLVISQELTEEQEKSDVYGDVTTSFVKNAKTGQRTVFAGAKHMDFTDLPMLSPYLGSMLGHGDIDPEECMTKVNSIVLNWFDHYIKHEGKLDVQSRVE